MVNARMLGAEVERRAASKGMTVADLGKAMECSELQVQFFLKGRAYASFAQMERLAAAFGHQGECAVDWRPHEV